MQQYQNRPLNPVLTQPLANDIRQSCDGTDWYPSYSGMEVENAPAQSPLRSIDGGDYFDGSNYRNSGYCYDHKPRGQIWTRSFVSSVGVPLASSSGQCMVPQSSAASFCQLSASGGWWPHPGAYNGGTLVKPSTGILAPSSWTFDNVGPWGLKQR